MLFLLKASAGAGMLYYIQLSDVQTFSGVYVINYSQ